MSRSLPRVLPAVLVAALLIPVTAIADHIPGHDNNDPVWPVPIPGREFFDGGVLFVTAIGPIGGYEVTNATFDITYISDGTTPAADIIIEAGVATEDGYVSTHVTGRDLGFGSGEGTFEGSFSTAELNGVVLEGFFPPYSTFDIQIYAENGGIEGSGYFVDSFINLDVITNGGGGDPLTLEVSGECPGMTSFVVSNASPGGNVAVLYANGTGEFVIPGGPCAGTQLGLNGSVKIGLLSRAGEDGIVGWLRNVPAGACGRFWVQAIDAQSCETSEVIPL